MNWDRVQGNWKQFKGKLQEKWGKLTDDQVSAIDGRRESIGRQASRSLWHRQGRGGAADQ